MSRFPRTQGTLDWPYTYRQFLRFLWSRIRPYRGRFWFASFVRMTSDIVWLFPAYALASIINILSGPHTPDSYHRITVFAILWIVAVLYRIGSQFVAKYVGFRVGETAAQEAYQSAFHHLLRLDMSWHEKENAGNKLKRIDRGALAINRMVRFWFTMVIEIGVNLIGMIFVISNVTPGMGLALVVFVIVYLVLSAPLTKYAAALENATDKKEEDIQGLAFEAVNNVRTIKALDMLPTLEKRMGGHIAQIIEIIRRRILRFQHRATVLNSWGQVFRLTSLLFIIYGVFRGQFTIGFLVLYQSYFSRLWESVGEISELAPDVVSAKFAAARMDQVLQEPVRIEDQSGKRPFPRQWQTLSLEHLSFSYDTQPVLQDMTLTLRRGERLGIVGLSGAGKSTLFKLLMKEHEGYSGTIAFDGISLRDIDKRSYLRSMAAVLQETEVFNFTLAENITIARPVRDRSRLTQALDVAHVTDFLHKLPFGLKTLIGEKGFRLSGGEKQRVGLARAIYKQPQLLLLDEATSHLDLESEKKIQTSLHEFFQTVTAIVIAHRLTTIKEMDRILVVENGRIVECGSFQELYRSRGRFYELWEQQKL